MTIKFIDNELIIGSTTIPENVTFRFSDILKLGGGGDTPSWQDIVLSGNGSLTLTNAKANGINYVKLFGGTEQLAENYIDSVTLDGKCEQSGTPTPTNPVDIVCNNGAIKAKRQSGLPLGYQMVEWLIPTGAIIITGFKTKSTQEIETVFYRERSGMSYLYSSDTVTSGTSNTTAYLTNGAGNWRWDGKTYSISVSVGTKVTSIQNKDGVWLNDTRLGWYSNAEDFVSTYDLRLSSSENTTIRIYSQTIREGEITTLDLVPVQRLSDSVYGFYDKVSGEFYTSTEATFVAGDIIDDPVEIYTDGTIETVTDNLGNVATAQRLLSVGGYKDTQEVLTGAVTRNVGVLVLDGTENWQLGSSSERPFYLSDSIDGSYTLPNTPFCTHFQGVVSTTTSLDMPDLSVRCGYEGYERFLYIKHKDLYSSGINAFKQWLTDQYNAGTPIIIVYPLETPTTETVTPQLLQKEPVTVTGSLTGLVANVVSSTHTTPTPTQPLLINCNNGVLGIDSQGNITVTGTTETVEVFGNNLIDLSAVTDGYYYDPRGNYTALSASRLTDYIPIEVGEDVKVYLKSLSSISNLNVRINIFNSNKVWQSQEVLQLSPLTDGTKIVTPTANGYIRVSGNYSGTAIVDWNTASITKSLGTATAEMLLKVGNYQDVQSVLDGVVIRKVGIKVLDGTENWAASGNLFYAGIATDALEDTHSCYCTHFKGVATNVSANYDNEIKVGTNVTSTINWTRVQIYPVVGTYSGVTALKQWLADQYANGTPVIVVYPTNSPTTETVTGQHLHTQTGTNTVEITQASIDNLGLEASYKGTV